MFFVKFFKKRKKEPEIVQKPNIIEVNQESNVDKPVEEEQEKKPSLDSVIEDNKVKKMLPDSNGETEDEKGSREVTGLGEKPHTNPKRKAEKDHELSH